MNECTVSVYDNADQAHQAIDILRRGGFPTSQVSVLTRRLKERSDVVALESGGDDSIRDAAYGAGLGTLVGALGGAELSMVMAMGGLFFLVGPLALGVTGTIVGALVGSMAGWGVHAKRIKHYEQSVEAGKVVVVATGNPLELLQADRILKETGPREHHLYAQTSSESPEVNVGEKLPKPTTSGGNRPPTAEPPSESHTARACLAAAAAILDEDQRPIKDRLWIAYASQLSQVDKQDLPESIRDEFWQLRYALSDADMPYGDGQRAKQKIAALTDEEAASAAESIRSMQAEITSARPASRGSPAQSLPSSAS
jgi:uncharacterized membrane protein